MIYRTWIIAVLALMSPLAAAEKPQPQYQLEATGNIVIGVDGSVRDYELTNELTPAIAKIVDRKVRGWKFEPILVDNKPVNAKTKMRLALQAIPVEAGYALKVNDVHFGEPEKRHNVQPPRYPRVAQEANLGAMVVLVLKVDGSGRVVEVHPSQTSLTARTRSETIAKQWRREFEKSSIAAAKHWTFDLSEEIDGKPVDTLVRIPVVYSMEGSSVDKGEWQAYVPGPVMPYPPTWTDVSDGVSAGVALASMKDGDMRSMKSRFRLKDNVVGEML